MRAAARARALRRVDRRERTAGISAATGNQQRGNGKGRCHPLR
ncbi:hypothetical protein BURMUCGD2M_0191 [Burkholderia multivorans CGD2M]|nr:hypothetical protein BURMUCGD1_0201 [Burkholderia multivorans CGD1]EEE10167.1 hypothetical protein BURMUCGD2M_0191 [Burkholderia multivorans CGD2M]